METFKEQLGGRRRDTIHVTVELYTWGTARKKRFNHYLFLQVQSILKYRYYTSCTTTPSQSWHFYYIILFCRTFSHFIILHIQNISHISVFWIDFRNHAHLNVIEAE